MKEVLIILAVACFLYPMRNLIGLLTRLSIYGMMAYTMFSGIFMAWDDKLFTIGMLSIPIIVDLLFKYMKYKIIKT